MLHAFIKTITPQSCINCNKFGELFCDPCFELPESRLEVCYRCNRLSASNKTCRACRSSSNVYSLTAYGDYGGLLKVLIHRMKYSNTREAGVYVARLIARVSNGGYDSITYVPSDSTRIRARGYDHARFMADELSRLLAIPVIQPLRRIKSTRQVGSTRRIRKKQMQEAFVVKKQSIATNQNVLLIDDVMSTGATVEEVARLLRVAGAKRVYVIVAAINR